MIVEKYTYRIIHGEYRIKKVYLLEEQGKYIAEFLENPLENPEAYSYRCDESYFDTKEEAKIYIDSLIPSIEEMNKVISYLDILTEKKFKEVEESLDYEIAFYKVENPESRMLEVLSEFVEPVRLMMRGFIFLNGETIRISDIQSVKWGGDMIYVMHEEMNSCEVYLRDGSKRKPSSIKECWMICVVFGHNFSNKLYPGIVFDFDSEYIDKYNSENGR